MEAPDLDVKPFKDEEACSEDMMRCGEVFLNDSQNLILVCGYCCKCFGGLSEFGAHIQEQHLNVEVVTDRDDNPSLAMAEPHSHNIVKIENEEDEIIEIVDSEVEPDISENEGDYVPSIVKEEQENTSEPKQKSGFALSLVKNETARPHKCPSCSKTFAAPTQLTAHILQHSMQLLTEKSSLDNCEICENNTREYLIEEIESRNREECPKCNYSIRRERVRSCLLYVKNGKRVCLVCNKLFLEPRNQRLHMRMHQAKLGNEISHVCLHCCSSFSTDKHLRRHENTFPLKTIYTCTGCERRYTRKNANLYHWHEAKLRVNRQQQIKPKLIEIT